jgi:hypothetical protein
MRRSINFWSAMQSHPPALIRLYARRVKGRAIEAITGEEIAIVSGIPLSRVHEISALTSWDGVAIPEAERFCKACNFDPTSARDRNRERAYSRTCRRPNRPRFLWVFNHPKFMSEFRPLIDALRKSPLASSMGFPPPASRTTS